MKINNRGLIIPSVLFVLLISLIGISLLAGTVFHIRIIDARERKNNEGSILQSNLISYLHNFREEVYGTDLNQFESVENEFFNLDKFPDKIDSGFIISNLFSNKIRYAEKYRSININNRITSSRKNKKLVLESIVSIDILSGNIPISAVPLYIKKNSELAKESFLKNNNINIDTISFLTNKDIAVKFDLSDYLIDSLDLNNKTLNWKDIREKAGVEINDTPLENGIYSFIDTESEDILNAIFIQGDVQKIVFSIEEKKQKLLITHEDKDYIIEYIPDKYNFTWKTEFEEPVLFKEKIIINGNIYSLISDEGFAFQKETNMSLYSSGIVYIDSSLNSDSSAGSSLKIITGYNEFFNKPANSGRVIINKDLNNKDIKLSATIIAMEKIINNNKNTIINGNIYADEIENNGVISLSPYFSESSIDPFLTTEKFTFIKYFNVSFNGEVYYD